MWHSDILHEVHTKGFVTYMGREPIWRISVEAFKRRAMSHR